MVVHQHIGMQSAAEPGQRFQKALQVTLAILVVEEIWQAVVAPLHDVQGNAGKIGTRKSGHADSFVALTASGDQGIAHSRIGCVPGTFFVKKSTLTPVFGHAFTKKGCAALLSALIRL